MQHLWGRVLLDGAVTTSNAESGALEQKSEMFGNRGAARQGAHCKLHSSWPGVPAIHVPLSPTRPRGKIAVMSGGWIYIMTNRPNGTLYVGVTSDLGRRAWEHREGLADGFTKRYGLKRLVYVERPRDIRAAIQREKNMKHWPRTWKVRLILAANPEWADLYDRLA